MAGPEAPVLEPRGGGDALRSIFAAILPPLTVFTVQTLFWSVISPFAWFLFYPAVFLSSWIGGFWSGVAATVLSTMLVWWRFLPPEGSFRIGEPKYLITTGVYIAMGLAFSAFHERLRRASREAAVALAASQRANERLKNVIDERRVFAALIENSSDFIGIADANGKPVYVNPAGRRMVGLSADYPVENTQIPEYYPPEVRAFVTDVIVKAMVEQGHWQGEIAFRHFQTQAAIPVSDTHFMIRDSGDGRTLGMGTVTRDISEIKRAREEAGATSRKLGQAHDELSRLYERTKDLDRLKNHMFAAVSHELRTPLTLILGPVHQLLAAPDLAEAARAGLQVIERNARALLHRVDDLLEVSKLDAGKARPEYAESDVARLVGFVASHFEVLAKEKHVAFAVEAPDELWAEVDPEKFRRVLLNLLSNAFKFTPDGGRVRVGVRPAGAARFVVEVADSGPGIPAATREVVFDPFRQLEPGATRRFGGTGLGLAIAREFVALHEGTVAIDHAPEGGALFAVDLPRTAPPRAFVRPRAVEGPDEGANQEVERAVDELRPRPAPLPAHEPRAPGAARVLVVEDNYEMNAFVAEALADEHRVASAFDGREGLTKALELRPDVIVTDMMMPEMSGEELTRAVRTHPELDGTPIVILSARTDDELRVRLLRQGAQDYLTKPFDVEELCTRVSNLVAKKRAEELLRAAEAKFRGIIAIAGDAIITLDDEHRIALYNEGAEEIFGWTREEIIGKPHEILLPARFREAHGRHLRSFAAGDASSRRMGARSQGIFGLRKNGEEFPAEAAISKLEVSGGNLLTVVLRDVTESKRLEKEQQFFAEAGAILGSTLDYQEILINVARLALREFADFCIVDLVEADGRTERLRVLHSDPAKASVCRLIEGLGAIRPSVVQSVMESNESLLVPEVTPETLESLAQSAEQLDAAREIDPRSGMIVPVAHRGRVFGALSFASSRPSRRYDRRDLILAEELARRAAIALENARLYEAAQRATQARDEVLGVVAHDLRNPLGTILLQAGLLRRGEADPERRKPAEAIERATVRMNRLIQDLLDVARTEAGKLAIECNRIPVAQVVLDSIETQKAFAAAASLELEVDLGPDLPDVWADRDRVLQVFENLVGNAIKFTGPGGRIGVGAVPRDREVLFWVSDTGSGIPSDDVPRVFDRFWQARRAERRGAGLGLPIVKGIVEAHGGRVWLESTPGLGSTFFFTIPTVARVEQGLPDASVSPRAQS
jgi:PAS domain S-box-containing protein